MRAHRTLWALALSLLLHAALLAFLATRPPVPAPPPPPEQVVLQFDIIDLPQTPPAPQGGGASSAPGPSHKPSKRAGTPSPSAAAQAQPSPAPAPGGAEVPFAQEGEFAVSPQRLRSLIPDNPQLGSVDGTAQEPATRGHTIVNDGSGPSKETLAEMDALQAKERLDGWISDDKADLKRANGLTPDYFREMKNALADGASHPPRDAAPEGSFGKQLFNSYRDQLQRYGASGSPTGALGGSEGRDALSPIARDEQRDGNSSARDTFNQMAHLRSLTEGMGGKMVAVVEIRQATNGAFVDARIVTASGNDLFDAFVLASAPSSVAVLPPLPSDVMQEHPDGVRSLWAFEGVLEYRKKARELETKTAGDKAYVAGMALLSLLTGAPFEETTGDIYVMDVANPKFRCNVKLLRLY